MKYIELITQCDFVHRIKFIAAAWLLRWSFIILYWSDKLRKKISRTAGTVKLEPAWVRKESQSALEELDKNKTTVIAKKCNEISDGQKVKSKEKEISRINEPVNSGKQERKRRNGQSDPLAYLVNSKLSQSDSKDRMWIKLMLHFSNSQNKHLPSQYLYCDDL